MLRAWPIVFVGFACLRQGEFKCETSADCLRSATAGTCEPNGYCSFPDGTCAGGSRFGEVSGPVTNQCVGGGDGGIDVPPGFFTVGGSLSGITSTIVLQNNGGDELSRSTTGSFVFPTALANGSSYEVTVAVPPTGQNCNIAAGSGVGTMNVTDVNVSCFTPGGSVGIHCAAATCAVGSQTCCVGGGTSECLAIATCAAAHVDCDDASDCNGTICCGSVNVQGNLTKAICQASCAAPSLVFCDPDVPNACATGACVVFAPAPDYFACQ